LIDKEVLGDEGDLCTRAAGAGSGRSACFGDRVGGARQRRLGFNARDISGFPTDSATLTGGGAYNPVSGFVNSGSGFRCTSDVGQGPLNGCLAGEGVRWDTVDLRRSTSFKCTGAAAESLKTAITDENTVGLDADFYRAGDGNDESFTAQMIVSADDICTRHRRDPERLDSGRRQWLGDRELQLLTATRREGNAGGGATGETRGLEQNTRRYVT
jgi:hypothetical protein